MPMAESTSGNGCLSSILFFIAAILSGFMAASSIAVTPPPATDIVYQVQVSPSASNFTAAELQQAAEVIRKRLDGLGYEVATIETTEDDISIGLPQVENIDDVVQIITARGLLEFVDFNAIPEFEQWIQRTIRTTGQGNHPVSDTAEMNPLTGEPFVTILTGADLERVEAIFSSQMQAWQLSLTFTEAAGEKLAAYTGAHIGQPLAIVLDGKVLSTPVVQSALGREAVIQAGAYTEESTRRLAVQLGGGVLPFEMRLDVIDTSA